MKMYIQSFIFFFLSSCLFFNKISAQLCQGSLGDPVVNITFGTGFQGSLPSGVTNYSFTGSTCPNDGSYTIASSSPDCFGGTWFTLNEDHTPGDVDGDMMIVNASFNPGDFFVQKVDGLCENTTYEFAAWILNILQSFACGSPIEPNVTFTIATTSGSILLSSETGNIPGGSGSWKQYGSFFTTPKDVTSVVIRMTNNAPGGCGNDLVLDDITFRPCGPLVTVNINGLSKSADVCSGDLSSFNFTGNISAGYDNPLYQWQVSADSGKTWSDIAGANTTTYKRSPVIKAGVYQYRLAVAQGNNITLPSCRIVSDIITINVNPLPVPDASSNSPVCEGKTLSFNSTEGSSFLWTGPQNFTSKIQFPSINNVAFSNTGKYYVKVTSKKGCVNTDSTVVITNTSPTANAGNGAEICEGKSVQLNGSGSNVVFYDWHPSNSLSDHRTAQPVASPTETTLYTLTTINGFCKSSDSVTIKVIKKPVANAGADQVIIKGQTAILKGTVGGVSISYLWTPDFFLSNTLSLKPSAKPPHDTSYILTVKSNVGCGTAMDTVLVKVFNDVYIPNAFTPNDDGKNDTWNIETLKAYPDAEVRIYNRYGQLLSDNHGQGAGWDGKYKGVLQTPGVYCYTIDLKNGRPVLKGVLILIL